MWARKFIGVAFSVIVITITFTLPRIVWADQSPSTSTALNSGELFPRGTWTLQTDGAYMRGVGQPRYEQLTGGQVSASYYVRNHASVPFELPFYDVNQSGPKCNHRRVRFIGPRSLAGVRSFLDLCFDGGRCGGRFFQQQRAASWNKLQLHAAVRHGGYVHGFAFDLSIRRLPLLAPEQRGIRGDSPQSIH